MSQFIIERKSQDSAMKYKMVVRINGGEKIELLPGEQKEIDLTDGSYEVVASLNLQKKTLKIEMPQENRVIISYTNGVQIESPNRAKEYDLGATSAPIVEKMIEEPIVTSSEAISEASVDVGNKMYCSQCGGQIEANSKFCKHCGASTDAKGVTGQNTNGQVQNNSKGSCFGTIVVLIVMVLIIGFAGKYCLKLFGGVSDTEICQEAETEIKSYVYQNSGEIPTLTSEIIYSAKDGKVKDSIVVVKYELENEGWSGSYAVHIHSGVKDAFVREITQEQEYDYDYESHIDELKVMYKIAD